MNPEAISVLIESNRYNIEILPQLENYVQHQVTKGTYHLEANLAVLKFYQFHPEKAQPLIIGNILIKALMNLPSTDFLMCTYLVAERFHTEEPIRTLNTLAQSLESAQFAQFWTDAAAGKEYLDKIPGFYDAIRGYIIGVLTSTYKTIPKDFLSDVLNLKGTELDTVANEKGWKQTADSVTFPRVEESTGKSKKITENIKFQDLGRILGSLY